MDPLALARSRHEMRNYKGAANVLKDYIHELSGTHGPESVLLFDPLIQLSQSLSLLPDARDEAVEAAEKAVCISGVPPLGEADRFAALKNCASIFRRMENHVAAGEAHFQAAERARLVHGTAGHPDVAKNAAAGVAEMTEAGEAEHALDIGRIWLGKIESMPRGKESESLRYLLAALGAASRKAHDIEASRSYFRRALGIPGRDSPAWRAHVKGQLDSIESMANRRFRCAIPVSPVFPEAIRWSTEPRIRIPVVASLNADAGASFVVTTHFGSIPKEGAYRYLVDRVTDARRGFDGLFAYIVERLVAHREVWEHARNFHYTFPEDPRDLSRTGLSSALVASCVLTSGTVFDAVFSGGDVDVLPEFAVFASADRFDQMCEACAAHADKDELVAYILFLNWIEERAYGPDVHVTLSAK